MDLRRGHQRAVDPQHGAEQRDDGERQQDLHHRQQHAERRCREAAAGALMMPRPISALLTMPLSPSMTSQEKLRTMMSTQYGISTMSSRIARASCGPLMVSA